MLRRKQIASYIDANFGKSPLDGGMYYDATDRIKLVRAYYEMKMDDTQVDEITWEDLEMDHVFLTIMRIVLPGNRFYMINCIGQKFWGVQSKGKSMRGSWTLGWSIRRNDYRLRKNCMRLENLKMIICLPR